MCAEGGRLLKPLPSFSSSPELRELAAIVSRDIYQHNPNVKWEDVVELDDAKRLLKEAVVMPTKYPQIFTGESSGCTPATGVNGWGSMLACPAYLCVPNVLHTAVMGLPVVRAALHDCACECTGA